MKHTITVLQDDIDNGSPSSAQRCAIALAAERELFVDNLYVNGLYIETLTERGMLPAEARTFISEFDQKLPVEPFKFEIDMEPKPPVTAYQGGFDLKYYQVTADALDALKDVYAKHTQPFQPKYTVHPSNEFTASKITSFAPGGPVEGSTA